MILHVVDLQVEKADHPAKDCALWTQGGLEGVQVRYKGVVIYIPREAIVELVANESINGQITKLEQKTAEDFGRELGLRGY